MAAFFAIPAVLISAGTIIGGAIVGLLYLIGAYGIRRTRDIKEAELANQYVIKSLQQKVQVLEDTLRDQQRAIAEAVRQIEGLKAENKTLQELVVKALEAYFENNPKVATNLSKNI